MSEKRIPWLDICRGIGIILVVLGHSAIPEVLRKYIFSFHMPLFFFISGFLFKKNTNLSIVSYVLHKVRTLLLPYFYFSIIIVICYYILNELTIKKGLINVLLGLGGHHGIALWFIISLFITEILFYIVYNNVSNKNLTIYILVSFVVGYIMYKMQIHLPYKFEVTFTAIVFYYLGYIFRKNDLLKSLNKYFYLFGLMFISILFSSLNSRVDMNYNQLGNIIYFYLSAISGILYLHIISINFITMNKYHLMAFLNKILIFLGMNSLIILAIHQITPQMISFLFQKQLYIKLFYSIFLEKLLTLSAILIIIMFINKYAPFLVGKKLKTNETKF